MSSSGDKVDSSSVVDGILTDDVLFLPKNGKGCTPTDAMSEIGSECQLLTKADLMRLDEEQPVWRRVRLGLFISFWVLWIGLIVAAALVIVFTPKCPPRPKQEFWQSKVGYWLDPFAYEDTSQDAVGDFAGVIKATEYITKDVGAGFIILTPIFDGQFSNNKLVLGLTKDFMKVDPRLGDLESFKAMLRGFRKQGVQVVLSMDLGKVSTEHSWTAKAGYLQPPSAKYLVSRSGDPSSLSLGGKSYYSTLGSTSTVVDLDLTSPAVVEDLLTVTRFWLNQGVDGIMLSGAAFYVKDFSKETSSANSTSTNDWFNNYPAGLLYTGGSLEFVKKVRTVVNDIATGSGKQRVLMVDSGNVGFGVADQPEATEFFLGSKEEPGAHVVVSRQFVNRRGWKSDPTDLKMLDGSIKKYNLFTTSESKPNLALATATSSDSPHSDIHSLVSVLLLPGTPIIYYGTELGNTMTPSASPQNIYPMGKTPLPSLPGHESTLESHLPMPWDTTGVAFSTNTSARQAFKQYIVDFGIEETVRSSLAAGRPYPLFKLITDLCKLRSEPSLLWGTFTEIASAHPDEVEIFTRTAEGFPAIVTVLTVNLARPVVFDFSATCATFEPVVTYPSNSHLPLKTAIPAGSVYFEAITKPSVYVFKCVS